MDIIYSSSFRLLPAKQSKVASPEEHKYIFDVHDIAVLQEASDNAIKQLGILGEMGGVVGLASALRTDLRGGLLGDEEKSKYERRKELYGKNVIPEKPSPGFFEIAIGTIAEDFVLKLLIVAGLVSLFIGIFYMGPRGDTYGWVEGTAILIAVWVVVTVGAINEIQQEKQFRILENSKEKVKCTVLRDGEKKQIPIDDILVGDVVSLNALQGSYIPADGIIITDDPIKVNESKMTGESRDINKSLKEPMLFGGTSVRQGECLMLVVAVGVNSAYGRIMRSLVEEDAETPLQKKLNVLVEYLGYLGIAVALLLFIIETSYWGHHVVKDNLDVKDAFPDVIDFFIVSVTVVVVAIPEGLPLAVIISLAYSMGQMYQDKCLVKKLDACETMGNATTICSDKTGTLTQNLMTVVEAWIGGRTWKRQQGAIMARPTKEDLDANNGLLKNLLVQGVVVNGLSYVPKKPADALDVMKSKKPEEWNWQGEGNQTDRALVSWLFGYNSYDSGTNQGAIDEFLKGYHEASDKDAFLEGKTIPNSGWKLDWLDMDKERERVAPVPKSFPFDSRKKFSSVVLKTDGTAYRQIFKGAPEHLLRICSKTIGPDGSVQELKDKKEIEGQITRMAHGGLRTIALAYLDYESLPSDPDTGKLLDPPESTDGVFFCVVGIQDPLRPDSRAAVLRSQGAGVTVRMVTGDHLETAKSIAMECEILTSKDHVAMLGEDLRALFASGHEEELQKIIPNLRVLARSKPQDKEQLVEWLMNNGQIVGATGDGTNDAPALKKANVGIAMGIAGTPVAQAAARIVILDDKFASVVNSIKWGRCVYDNIKKFVQFQVTVNLVALTITLIGALADYGNPLTGVQLLWVNLIMDTMAALALGTEKPTDALLDRTPYDPNVNIISKVMWRNILCQTFWQLAVLLFLLFTPETVVNDAFPGDPDDHHKHFTIIFNTFVWMQIFNEINSRKVNAEQNVFENFFDNMYFPAILVFTVLMQIAMVQVFGKFTDTVPLSIEDWGVSVLFGLSGLFPIGVLVRLIPVDVDAGRVPPPEGAFKRDLPEYLARQGGKSEENGNGLSNKHVQNGSA